MDEFYPPSERALNPRANRTGWLADYEHLLDECPIGRSIKVGLDVVKVSTLRATIHKYAKAKNKRFTVVKHLDCYEIYRKE